MDQNVSHVLTTTQARHIWMGTIALRDALQTGRIGLDTSVFRARTITGLFRTGQAHNASHAQSITQSLHTGTDLTVSGA